MKLKNQVIIKQATLQQSGLFIMAGGFMLVIEFILLQFNLVAVELPDHRIDTLSIVLAIAAWLLLLAGIKILSTSGLLQQKRKLFWIPITGLIFYTLGCFAIVFEQWTLLYIVPAGLLLTAIGMLVFIREKIWPGWVSYSFILVGLYPFLCMFPIVAMNGAPNYSVNYFWGVLWVILGLGLRTKSYSY